jgi:anaerobic selenocysteine-containing dehydrogenase
LAPDPVAQVNPAAAKMLNVVEGDWLWLETPKVKGERVKFKTNLTERIHPKMVHVPHGWWFPERAGPEHGCFDSNISVVMSGDPPRDIICGSVATRGTLCKIYKA